MESELFVIVLLAGVVLIVIGGLWIAFRHREVDETTFNRDDAGFVAKPPPNRPTFKDALAMDAVSRKASVGDLPFQRAILDQNYDIADSESTGPADAPAPDAISPDEKSGEGRKQSPSYDDGGAGVDEPPTKK